MVPSPRYGTSTSTKAQSQEAVRGKQINFGNSSPANPYLQGYRGRSVQYSQSHKRTHHPINVLTHFQGKVVATNSERT